MSVMERRRNPLAEMLGWLEDSDLRAIATPQIRVEDFVEEGSYVLRAELPGVDPEKDIEVEVTGDVLTITGRRQEEERDKNHSEFRYGSFTRSVRIPAGCDPASVAATYSNGVLEVRVPIGEARQEVTKVPVQRTEK